jgi:PAS domain-containing protein
MSVLRSPALLHVPATVLFTVPSSDRAFAEFVRRVAERNPPGSPVELQGRLRTVYPRALVRPRALSNDDHTWYVYREGRWVDGSVPDWWTDESMPRLQLDSDGFVASANAAAGEELGVDPKRLVHRHFTDFAVPGSLDDAILLRQIVLDIGEAGGTIRHLRANGEVRIAEYRAITTESGTTVVIRPVGPSSSPPAPRPSISIECSPVVDRLFAVVAEGILARIPEPTPKGLELRLGRSYPYASVEAIDENHWRVTRDQRTERPAVRWDDPGLACTVALDTSLITEANESALQLLGRDLVGRHWHELAVPSSLDQRLEMRDFYVANGGAESTFRLYGAGGQLVDYDYRLSWQGDTYTTVMAPFQGR